MVVVPKKECSRLGLFFWPFVYEKKAASFATVLLKNESGILCRRFFKRRKRHLMLPFLLDTKAASEASFSLRDESGISGCRFS